jgi:SWI/SNF chromatin-remodeling complex subunit SWI1
MAAMQDPKIMQIVGQNPQAQMIQSAMMAHINEHVAFEYRKQIEQAMGMVLPSEENQKNLTTEQADQIAMMAAQASQQLLQQNKQEAAAQQAQQQAQDPVVQMQQQELQIKMQELQLKAQKQQLDAAAKADQLEIEKSRIMAQKEIAAMQVGANAAAAKDKLNKMQEMEGVRIGIDAAKHKAQMQRNQPQQNRTPRDKKE